MQLASLRRLFEHRHHEIAYPLKLHLARAPTAWLAGQSINAPAVEHFNPEPHHSIAAIVDLAHKLPPHSLQKKPHCP